MSRSIEFAIQLLIVLSLVTFSLETLPDLSRATRSILHGFEVFTVAVFTVEYIWRLVTAPQRMRLAFVILLIGLGVISVPAGLVASALSKAREIED